MREKQTFFIVDDDQDIINVQTAVLESAGHQVHYETSGLKALSRILEERPDCILVDIMMPDMDGLELCLELRRHEEVRDSDIIVVSGKSYDFDRQRAMQFGASGYIQKPFEPRDFLRQVEKIVAGKIEITFWGVRGTLPVPGKRAIKYGGNTSCVTLEFPKGEVFIFDAGTGIKAFSDYLIREGKTRIDARIFISHPHWDHINALPFFVPLYIQGNEFEILGSSHGDVGMRELISAQMDGVYFPINISEFAASVTFRDLKEETLELGDIRIRTMLLNHPGYCLGYRIEYEGRSVCYVTDNELYPPSSEFYNEEYRKKLNGFLDRADLLITDTTYTEEEYRTKSGWGHSTVNQAVEVAHRAGVKTICLFHHDPGQGDLDIDEKLKLAEAILEKHQSTTRCLAPAENQRIKI